MEDFINKYTLVWFAISGITSWAAGSRGRSAFGWFIYATFFSFIAFFVVYSLPVINKNEDQTKRDGESEIYVEKDVDVVAPVLRSPIFDDVVLIKSGQSYSVCGVCFNPITKNNSDLKRCCICDASLSYRTDMTLIDAEVFNKRYINDFNERESKKNIGNKYNPLKSSIVKITEGFVYQMPVIDSDKESHILELIRFIEGLKEGKIDKEKSIENLKYELKNYINFIDFILSAIVLCGAFFGAGLGLGIGAVLIGNLYILIRIIMIFFERRSKKAELVKLEKQFIILVDVLNRHKKILTEEVTALVVNIAKELGAIELSKIVMRMKVEKYKFLIKEILSSCKDLQVIELKESNDVLYRSLAQENGGNITTVYLDDDEDLRDDGSNQMA